MVDDPIGLIPSDFREPLRVLVCGGRSYSNYEAVCEALDTIHVSGRGIHVIIHGNASGADALAERWAKDRRVKALSFPADWRNEGRRAGPLRNQRMIEQSPDVVLAFPGGRGTDDMVARAERARILVLKAKAQGGGDEQQNCCTRQAKNRSVSPSSTGWEMLPVQEGNWNHRQLGWDAHASRKTHP